MKFRYQFCVSNQCQQGRYPCNPPVRVQQTKFHARRVPLSKGRHAGGWFSPAPSWPLLRYESQLELRAISAITALTGCVGLETQPFTVFYTLHGQTRWYTPDLLVRVDQLSPTLLDLGFQQRTAVEIKPDAFPRLQRYYCSRRVAVRAATGLRLIVLGERAIEQLEWEVRYGQR